MTRLSLGLANMTAEAGEKRAFLPSFVSRVGQLGYEIVIEEGYGEQLGFSKDNYFSSAPNVRFANKNEVFQQDLTLVLRYPGNDLIRMMKTGSCIISMLHYPTRPNRVALLKSQGIEALSLDSIKDETGRRLVENLKAVAWNGLEIAFKVLAKIYPFPGFENPERPPIRATLLGSGAVGRHAVQAAIRYGDENYWKQLASKKMPGVQVTVVDYDVTNQKTYMQDLLTRTDILIDATQRPDPSQIVIPNAWIGLMPAHAVLLDLSVDPYDFSVNPPEVKGIEGIPQGNLDKYIFPPNDPVYQNVPKIIKKENRRHVVSCYSWPGIHPQQCMDVYGMQISPLLRVIYESKGIQNINSQGSFFHRAVSRAMLSRWQGG